MGQASTDLTMSSVMIGVLHFSTESVTATWLLPEMVERVASMLNYFLNVLTGECRAGVAKPLAALAASPWEMQFLLQGCFWNMVQSKVTYKLRCAPYRQSTHLLHPSGTLQAQLRKLQSGQARAKALLL